MDDDAARWKIGEVVRASGLSRKALMILEIEGALVPRRGPNGYRIYSEDQARLAGIARRLKEAGLSVADVRMIMEAKRGKDAKADRYAATEAALRKARAGLLERRRAVDEALLRLDGLIEECAREARKRRRG